MASRLPGFHLGVCAECHTLPHHSFDDPPGSTIQLTLHDQTAVHFPYKDPRWNEFVLILYHNDSLPNLNRWDRVRYQIVRRALLKLYRDPFNFRKNAVGEERVRPVLAPPADGRPG